MKPRIYALLAALVGCAEQSYVYQPETANATTSGLPATRTQIPPERPQGAVEVASYGITQLRPEGAVVPALHVRMIASNDGDETPWQIDTTQQYVAIPGEGRSRAMFVNSNAEGLQIVTVPRHERRVLDLYFPLPDTIRSDARLPAFELQWTVLTPEREVASSTSFDRIESTPAYAYTEYPYYAGYGPYWWYDPFYPSVVFAHSRPIVFRSGTRVHVGQFSGHFRAGGAHVAHRR